MRRLCAIALCAVAAASMRQPRLGAADVTFTRDVAPILHARCVSCHRAGEVAPMALLTYEDARPWARAIKEKVVTRQMPPWFADPAVGSFANDARLSDARDCDHRKMGGCRRADGRGEGHAEGADLHAGLAAGRA